MSECIVTIILAYAWLKKYTFLPSDTFLSFPYTTIGLSYIFFRVLHLLIESSDRGFANEIGVGSYLVYTLNFTTLISGPIQRYDEFAKDQFAEAAMPLSASVIGAQLERIVLGLFKVNVLALILNVVQADSLVQLSEPISNSSKATAALMVVVIYPFFLYCNFSGYMDIVIAIARLLRVRLPENFDRPFSSTSFIDFWNRWHITLSTWLKTYVYNPSLLTLMRRLPSPTLQPFIGVFCFFVTFFLIGIWHGRTSEFAFFGVLQGGGVAVNKLWQIELSRWIGRKKYKAVTNNPLYQAVGRGLTFSWFAFTLLWFWGSWNQIHMMFTSIENSRWLCIWLVILTSSTGVLAFWEWARGVVLGINYEGNAIFIGRHSRVIYTTVFVLAIFVMGVLLAQPAPDVVYKAF